MYIFKYDINNYIIISILYNQWIDWQSSLHHSCWGRRILKHHNQYEINSNGLKLMGGAIKILNLLSMMMDLSTLLAIDISSQARKCPSLNNGPKLLSASILTIPYRRRRTSPSTHPSKTPHLSNQLRVK